MTLPRGALPIGSNNPSPRLILASESPRRTALLAQAGITPDWICPAKIDETPRRAELPRLYAARMAAAKAETVARAWEGVPALVLAADTVVAAGRRILPKAETADEVRACLDQLSGRRHVVFTAIAVVGSRATHPLRSRLVATRVSFKRLSSDEMDSYVASGEGNGKAGGYAIQGRAEGFVRALNGSYSNVVGLPLLETLTLLGGFGYVVC
jgi:septum formation protein